MLTPRGRAESDTLPGQNFDSIPNAGLEAHQASDLSGGMQPAGGVETAYTVIKDAGNTHQSSAPQNIGQPQVPHFDNPNLVQVLIDKPQGPIIAGSKSLNEVSPQQQRSIAKEGDPSPTKTDLDVSTQKHMEGQVQPSPSMGQLKTTAPVKTEAVERKTTLDAAASGNAGKNSATGGPASMGSKSTDHRSHGKIVYQKASSSVGKRQMEVSINAAAVGPSSPEKAQATAPTGNLFINPPMRLQNIPNQVVAAGDYANEPAQKLESAAQAKLRLSSQPQSTKRRGS